MSSFLPKNPVEKILNRLDGVKQMGNGQYMACCPVHCDQHASLSVGEGFDGRALINCKAGCSTDEILKALNMNTTDLFATPFPATSKPAPKAKKPKKVYPTPDEAILAAGRIAKGKFVNVWGYDNTYFMVRFALTVGGKSFRPIHKVDGGWVIGDPPGPLPLYRGDKIGNAGLDGNDPVFVVEGEKCADAAAGLGFTAVTR